MSTTEERRAYRLRIPPQDKRRGFVAGSRTIGVKGPTYLAGRWVRQLLTTGEVEYLRGQRQLMEDPLSPPLLQIFDEETQLHEYERIVRMERAAALVKSSGLSPEDLNLGDDYKQDKPKEAPPVRIPTSMQALDVMEVSLRPKKSESAVKLPEVEDIDDSPIEEDLPPPPTTPVTKAPKSGTVGKKKK